VTTNTLVAYYSTYGHIYRRAQAVAEGAKSVPDAEVRLRRIPELEEARRALSSEEAYLRSQQLQAEIPEIHGGHETTIITGLVPLLHLGMIFVGTPYGQNPQLLAADGIGGSPYGPGTVTGPDGSREPTEVELATARNLGSRLARVAGRLKELRRS